MAKTGKSGPKPKHRQKTSQKKIERQARILRAVQLRAEGKEYQEIASLLGISKAAAFQYVTESMAQSAAKINDSAVEVLAREWAITNELLSRYAPDALAGDKNAAALVLRILDRRAKYRGLDAPTRIDNVNPNGNIESAFLSREQMKLAVERQISEHREAMAAAAQAREEERREIERRASVEGMTGTRSGARNGNGHAAPSPN